MANISWISFDQHNDRTGESLITTIQEVNNRPVCILYNAGNENPFRNLALDQAGFKFSQQGVWVCPVEFIDLAAFKAAFPLMEFEDVVTPVSSVVEPQTNSPNSFLSTMFRNAFEEEYAPGLTVKRYDGHLPPAGESLAYWLEENGIRRSSNTYEARYSEGTNVTVTLNKRNREVSVLFHDVEFHNDLEALYLRERNEVDAEIGKPFVYQSKLFIRLADNTFAPAIERSTGPLALSQFACPSPQEVLRRIDLESLAKVMTETEWQALQHRQAEASVAEHSEEQVSDTSTSENPADPEEFSAERHIQFIAGSIDTLKSHDVEKVLDTASELGDVALYRTYAFIRDNREDLIEELNKVFDDASGFLVDSACPELAELAAERLLVVTGQDKLSHLKAQMAGSVLGKELKHETESRWGFVSPDTTDTTKYRYTLFDNKGFFAHQVYNTEQAAFDALVTEQGYNRWDIGALKAVETTDAFLEGMIEQAKATAAAEQVAESVGAKAITKPVVLTEPDRAKEIVTLFQARSDLAEKALSHDNFRTEKEGEVHALYFKDHADPVAHFEGRPSKAKAIAAMDDLAVAAVREVAGILSEKFDSLLKVPAGHTFKDFDVKRDVRFVESVGSTQISCYIKPGAEVSPHRRVDTEIRINLHQDQPSAFLFMRSGTDNNFKGIDLLSAAGEPYKFPKASTFSELAEKIAGIVNDIAAVVAAAPEPVTETPVVLDTQHSERYSYLHQWSVDNPRAACKKGFIEQLHLDPDLNDGEAELLESHLEALRAATPTLATYEDAMHELDTAASASQLSAIKDEIEESLHNDQIYFTKPESREFFTNFKNRLKDFNPSPSSDEQASATDTDSHWALDYVNADVTATIDQLEDAAHSRGHTLHWFTLERELTGTQLICRTELGEDVTVNNDGKFPQARSLLDLYIKTNRAVLVRSVNDLTVESTFDGESAGVDITGTPEVDNQVSRPAGENGEYGLDDIWYSPGQIIPTAALDPKQAQPATEMPAGQQMIYPRIRNFVTPDSSGVTLTRRDIKDSELVNYFNSVAQFNALVDRFNSGKRYYSPEWLMLNYSAVPEVAYTLPEAPAGSQAVTHATPINYTAIIRNSEGAPFMVLTKRHGRMQIAEFEDGKPVVHSDCPVVDVDGQTYYFAGEWWENGQIVVQPLPETAQEPAAPILEDSPVYLTQELTELLSRVDGLIEKGTGLALDIAAKALQLSKRKKGEKNPDRSTRLSEVSELIKELATGSADTLFKNHNLPAIKGFADTLGINTSAAKKALCDRIYSHLESLGSTYMANKDRRNLLTQLSEQIERGESISLEAVRSALDSDSLTHSMAYTPGDIQIAIALGETHLKPKGQRNEQEAYYEAMAELLSSPLAVLKAKGLFDTPEMENYLQRRRAIVNHEIVGSAMASHLKCFVPTLGLPPLVNLAGVVLALDDDLAGDQDIDMSFAPYKESIPTYEKPVIAAGNEYPALASNWADAQRRWQLLGSQEVEMFPHEVKLLLLITEAKLAGKTNWDAIQEYILTNHPDFFPADTNNGTSHGSGIKTEIICACQYLRDAEPPAVSESEPTTTEPTGTHENEITISDLEDQTAPKSETDPAGQQSKAEVVSLFGNKHSLADKEIDEAGLAQLMEDLQAANLEYSDLTSYLQSVSMVELAKNSPNPPTEFEMARALKELDKSWNILSSKAASGGMVLVKDVMDSLALQMSERISDASAHSTDPWMMLPETVQMVLTDTDFVQMANSISNEKTTFKALFIAKRFGVESTIRLLERALIDHNAEHPLIPEMLSEFERFARKVEIKGEIDKILDGASEDSLSTYRWQTLSSLREELAELEYDVSAMEITAEMIEIYRNTPDYVETYEALAKLTGMDQEGAKLLSERISEHLRAIRIAEIRGSDLFKMGQAISEKMPGFTEQSADDTETVGVRYIGPRKALLEVPKLEDGHYRLSVSLYPIDRTRESSDYETFTVQADHENPKQALVDQVVAYLSDFETVVKTENLPEYGAKLFSGENGEKLYNLTEINKRIRADIKEFQEKGDIPSGVKISVRKSSGSIRIEIMQLPADLPMVSSEYAQWKLEEPDGHHSDAPSMWTADYRALKLALEAIAEAYNYDDSDSQSDYFNTNFYLHVEADSDLRTQEIERAIDAYKTSIAFSAEVSEPEIEATTTPADADQRDREYALPWESKNDTAPADLVSISKPLQDHLGNPTGWHFVEISKDNLGLTSGGGTLLINPLTMECQTFETGDRTSHEAYIRAVAFAVENPIGSAAPQTALIINAESQHDAAESNAAQLLDLLNLSLIDFSDDRDMYVTVENHPYKDLVIELQPSVQSAKHRTLIFTHYTKEEDTLFIDAEVVFEVKNDGTLLLTETATSYPGSDRTLRGNDRSFANLLTSNLLKQGFGNGHVINHNLGSEEQPKQVSETITHPQDAQPAPAKPTDSQESVDWLSAPLSDFKAHLDSLKGSDDVNQAHYTMLLAYRFGSGRTLERAEEIDLKLENGTATTADRAMLLNLQNVWKKKLDDALDKETNHETRNASPISDDPGSVARSETSGNGAETAIETVSGNQQSDDSEEIGAVDAGIPSDQSSTPQSGVSDSSQLAGGSSDVPSRDAEKDDRPDFVSFNRNIDFFPREEIVRMESADAEAQRAAFSYAITTLRKIREQGYTPTQEDRKLLASINGAGLPVIAKVFQRNDYSTPEATNLTGNLSSLFKTDPDLYRSLKASVTDAYYTPSSISDFMWNTVTKMGISNKNYPLHVTEPSIASGRFIGLAPEDIRAGSVITGIEKDGFTAGLAEVLYPEVKVINEGFEDVVMPSNSQDLVIGNPPYGDYTIYDRHDKRQYLIHDYFLKRSIDLAKPGGFVAFVTSAGTLDKTNNTIRRKLAEKADLVTAFRLPSTAFNDAGASVVTDILFFQKRHPGQEPANRNWLEVNPIDVASDKEESGFKTGSINQYYLDNPHHVLGDLKWTTSQYGETLTVAGKLENHQLIKMLDEEVPGNIFSAEQHPSHKRQDQQRTLQEPRFEGAKIGSYVVTDDGIAIVTAAGIVPHSSKGIRAQKLTALIEIRDLTLKLIDAERGELSEEATKHRQALNIAYDQFVAKYGFLNAKANKRLLSLDPDQYLVLALEAKSPNTDEYLKADIFSISFQAINSKQQSVESVSDAVLFLLNTKGEVHPDAIADLLKVDTAEVIEPLQEICFQNPVTGTYELKALYLSGNIYQKLEYAEQAAKHDPSFQHNVAALQAVLPPKLNLGEINTRLGASWIPKSIVWAFICDKLQCKLSEDRVRLTYVPETHSWDLRLTQSARTGMYKQNDVVNGAGGYRFDQLMSLTLNQKTAIVRDKHGHIASELTTLAKAKQKELIQDFRSFILANAEYASQVEESYNRTFNAYKEADYDGSYMTFPGMSGVINGNPLKLRTHQPAVIERTLHSETGTLIAHEAGAGKTIEQIAAAIEMKRLGLATKPLFVIPNHMLEQATKEARDLYPNAKILTATPDDFAPNGRALFANKVKMNDWDLVICTHGMFTAMAPPPDFVKGFIQNEIDQYETALLEADNTDRITIKNLEKAKKKVEAKLKRTLLELEDRQDEICFGECGFDALFYDEGHYLKNYAPPTSLSSVAGVNNTTSNRAMDAVIKADYIRYKRGDEKGVTLATGTPITNSVSEVWVMLRIVAPSLLKEAGLDNFDNFAATFCEVVEHIELKPEGGGYQMKARLSRFHNVPELIRLFRMVADIKMAEDLNLPTPKATDIKHVAPQSAEMALFMDYLTHRAIKVRNRSVELSDDNILNIANDGRSASLDLRLIHELLPDDPNSKLNMCVQNVYDKYVEHAEDRRTQIVFCDRGTPKPGFNLYDDMKQKWIKMGIPANEIAFIHEAKTAEQKEAIFTKVRAGEIRILLGSTDKLGVGTNVQTRGSDLHMLDIPWRPTDLKQRRKRFERQGNLFDDVNIHFYTTEDSFDLFMLETAVRKLKFVTQAMCNPDKAARRLDEDIDPTLSEIMAITTGNSLIRDKVEVDSKVDQLLLMRNAHESDCRRLLGEAAWIENNRKPSYEKAAEGAFKAFEAIGKDSLESGQIPFIVEGKTYTKPKEAGVAIHNLMKHQLGAGNTVATIAGYPLISKIEQDHFSLVWEGPTRFRVNLTKDPARFTQNLINKMLELPSLVDYYRTTLTELDQEFNEYKQKASRPFSQAAELEDLMARKIEIDTEVAKMDKENSNNRSVDLLHEFEDLISELNARQELLSDDEIAMYQEASNLNLFSKPTHSPGA